jgi:hypothetical protein
MKIGSQFPVRIRNFEVAGESLDLVCILLCPLI